jgi:hypothetical protein
MMSAPRNRRIRQFKPGAIVGGGPSALITAAFMSE